MKERNIAVVIKEITELFPDTEKFNDLKARLESVVKDSTFRAPELMYLSWRDVYEELTSFFMMNCRLKRGLGDLGVKVFSILSTKSEDTIKSQIYPLIPQGEIREFIKLTGCKEDVIKCYLSNCIDGVCTATKANLYKESYSCADIFRKEMSLNIGKEHSN